MKVAWLFFGLPRSPGVTSENFLRLMKLYDSEVVAHFWTCDENGKEDYYKREWNLAGRKPRPVVSLSTHLDAVAEFKQIYSPARLMVEPCIIAKLPVKTFRSYYGQQSAQRALNLIDPKQFDIIVRCRTDVVVHPKEVTKLPFDGSNKLYSLGAFFDPAIRVNDTFMYGCPDVMAYLINAVDRYAELSEPEAIDVHTALARYCREQNYTVVTVGGPASGRKIGK